MPDLSYMRRVMREQFSALSVWDLGSVWEGPVVLRFLDESGDLLSMDEAGDIYQAERLLAVAPPRTYAVVVEPLMDLGWRQGCPFRLFLYPIGEAPGR